MMNYFSWVILFSALLYAAFILRCVTGWRKIKLYEPRATDFSTQISLLIPVRNEEKNIASCLHDILNQNYPDALIEIIVVDDDSTDRTAEIVRVIQEKNPARRILFLKNDRQQTGSHFKKQAITTAVNKARGELIVTTDADCRMSENWLATIVSYFETERPWMIASPVCFDQEKTIFEKLQALEFMGLIGIGAGAISNLKPVMCNGANLAYTKKIFLEVKGFTDGYETASGDDTQLMLKIAKKNSSKIHFLKAPEAIVYTGAMHSVSDLIHQRKRWASKIPTAMGSYTLFIAVIAYLLHLGLLILGVTCLFHPFIAPVFLSVLMLKAIPEFILLRDMNTFFAKKNLVWLFFPAQLLYIVYISFIGAVAPFGSYRWKGREIASSAGKLTVE